MFHHYPTCVSWRSGRPSDCTCAGHRPWKILRDGTDDAPWTVYRRTGADRLGNSVFDRFLSCETFEAARQLVVSMIWLSSCGLTAETRSE